MHWNNESYLGWNSICLTTDTLQMNIVPALGGRIMHFALGHHSFLWVNPLLAGKTPPPGGTGFQGEWLNWGGDKLWIAPQGWDTEEQWPGPPDDVLDGGHYDSELLYLDEKKASVRLTSAATAASGIQLSRIISLADGSSRVNIVAKMTNVGNVPNRWGIWAVTQVDATDRHTHEWNRQLKVITPANPNSAYPDGYYIIYGDEVNPQFRNVNGLVEASYQRIVGKIGIDTDAGWVATIDGTTGYVLVQRMPYQPAMEYPDECTVEIWTNGLGVLTAYGHTEPMPEDVAVNPYLLECELLSPFATLQPGESYEFQYDWYAARLGVHAGGSHSVIDCSAVGCTVAPLTISAKGEISGHFGVFYEGCAMLEFWTDTGTRLGKSQYVAPTSPTSPLMLSGIFNVAEQAHTATLSIYEVPADTNSGTSLGRCIGELARTMISQAISTRH